MTRLRRSGRTWRIEARSSSGVTGFQLLDRGVEPGPAGDAHVGRFAGVVEGQDVVGFLHLRPQGQSVLMTITFGVAEELVDTRTVHDRVLSNFRVAT